MEPCAVEAKRFARYVAEPPELDAAIAEIREIDRRGGMERTLAIGRLVLHRFFGGSVEAWRQRSKHKNNSVRRIAQHPQCPLSRSAINQAIGIFVALQALACDQTFGHIGPSHVAVVLHLRPPAQKHWLELAEKEAWSVRRLKEQLVAHRRNLGERRGRPRISTGDHLFSTLGKRIRSLEVARDQLRGVNWDSEYGPLVREFAQRITAVGLDLRTMFRLPDKLESGPPNPLETRRVRTRLREAG